MALPDLNLLVTLDVLLAERSVARAAERLRLSPSAMSRQLARLRAVTGDPLLVRAGRGLVPTPRALELADRVGRVVEEAEAVLRPADAPDLSTLARDFTLRASDGFVENFGPDLIDRVARAAPGVRLRFVARLDKADGPLRDGRVDLDVGVVGARTGPDIHARSLFRDRFVGVVQPGHPLLTGAITPERYAAARHVLVSRRGLTRGPIDDALDPLGLARDVAVVVAGFSAALALARVSDLVAGVPERQTGRLREDLRTFPLPVAVAPITVAMQWHPRLDADPAHRWLRTELRRALADHSDPDGDPGTD